MNKVFKLGVCSGLELRNMCLLVGLMYNVGCSWVSLKYIMMSKKGICC